MKEKTSITLSGEILAAIDRLAGSSNLGQPLSSWCSGSSCSSAPVPLCKLAIRNESTLLLTALTLKPTTF